MPSKYTHPYSYDIYNFDEMYVWRFESKVVLPIMCEDNMIYMCFSNLKTFEPMATHAYINYLKEIEQAIFQS